MRQPPQHTLPYEELPLGPLDPLRIEALWRYGPVAGRRQAVLPDGRMDLVAHAMLDASGGFAAVNLAIAGPADRPSTVAHRAAVCSVGVRFQLGWGGACLGLDPAALVNQVLTGSAAEQALGPLATPVLAATCADGLQHALAGAAAALARRAGPATGPSQARALQALRWLRQHPGAPLQALCTALALPERTLRRDVLAAVGLPLRSLAGILRFQRAMALVQGGRLPSLAHLAQEAGYADQAHMTRQFRKLGGFTPALPQLVPVVA